MKRCTVLERFHFVDGIRWAWVTYEYGPGVERRCVGVEELPS